MKKIIPLIVSFTIATIAAQSSKNSKPQNNSSSPVTLEDKRLPINWNIEKTITVSQNDLPNFSTKFGGKIISLVNYILKADGHPFQINIIQADSTSEAKKVYLFDINERN
jgi:hypothetical protein